MAPIAGRATAVIVTVLIGSLLVGCSADAAGAGAARSPSEADPSASEPSAGADRGALSPLDRQYADDLWNAVALDFPDAVRPVVPAIRYAMIDQWHVRVADCLQGAGWNATAGEDGGVTVPGLSANQQESFAIQSYVCRVSNMPDPRYRVALTDEQIGLMYDYFVDELTPCLQARSIEVPPPPSRARFIETYPDRTGVVTSDYWAPYLYVQPSSANEWMTLERECPQLPPDLYR